MPRGRYRLLRRASHVPVSPARFRACFQFISDATSGPYEPPPFLRVMLARATAENKAGAAAAGSVMGVPTLLQLFQQRKGGGLQSKL